MGRRRLSFSGRVDIAVGILAGKTDRQIAVELSRDHTIIRREHGRNSTKTGGYRQMGADCGDERWRRRPQARKIELDPALAVRVKADLSRSRTLRQIAGRLHLEATDASVETMTKSPDAEGCTVSHEAIYRWIYALPMGEHIGGRIIVDGQHR